MVKGLTFFHIRSPRERQAFFRPDEEPINCCYCNCADEHQPDVPHLWASSLLFRLICLGRFYLGLKTILFLSSDRSRLCASAEQRKALQDQTTDDMVLGSSRSLATQTMRSTPGHSLEWRLVAYFQNNVAVCLYPYSLNDQEVALPRREYNILGSSNSTRLAKRGVEALRNTVKAEEAHVEHIQPNPVGKEQNSCISHHSICLLGRTRCMRLRRVRQRQFKHINTTHTFSAKFILVSSSEVASSSPHRWSETSRST